MGVDVADQGVDAGYGGLGDTPVDQLGVADLQMRGS
jgi:hypothetical protein